MAERPTKVLKLGGIEVAQWEKATEDGKTLTSYSFQKTYKDNNTDEWKHTTFFKLSDLSVLASLIQFVVGSNVKLLTPLLTPEKADPKIEGNTVEKETVPV